MRSSVISIELAHLSSAATILLELRYSLRVALDKSKGSSRTFSRSTLRKVFLNVFFAQTTIAVLRELEAQMRNAYLKYMTVL